MVALVCSIWRCLHVRARGEDLLLLDRLARDARLDINCPPVGGRQLCSGIPTGLLPIGQCSPVSFKTSCYHVVVLFLGTGISTTPLRSHRSRWGSLEADSGDVGGDDR